MHNRFNLNEEEKERIRGLHYDEYANRKFGMWEQTNTGDTTTGGTESQTGKTITEQEQEQETPWWIVAGLSVTPFGKLFASLKAMENKTENDVWSNTEIALAKVLANVLPLKAATALKGVIKSAQVKKDNVNEQVEEDFEDLDIQIDKLIKDNPRIKLYGWSVEEKNDLMSKVDDIHRILTTPSKPWNK